MSLPTNKETYFEYANQIADIFETSCYLVEGELNVYKFISNSGEELVKEIVEKVSNPSNGIDYFLLRDVETSKESIVYSTEDKKFIFVEDTIISRDKDSDEPFWQHEDISLSQFKFAKEFFFGINY